MLARACHRDIKETAFLGDDILASPHQRLEHGRRQLKPW
jgi:hypothetical protein